MLVCASTPSLPQDLETMSRIPNYLLVRPGETFVWDIPNATAEVAQASGAINGQDPSTVQFEYGKEYTYEGTQPLVIRYYYNLSAPYAVLLNMQYAAPLPDAGIVQTIHNRTSAYTSNGRVFFTWQTIGRPVSVFLEWDNLDAYAASVGLGLIIKEKGRLQIMTVPTDKVSVFLAGPPEVTLTLTEGRVDMRWYATGVVPTERRDD